MNTFSDAHDFNISDSTINVSGRDINTNYYNLSSDEESKLKEWLAAPDYSIHFATAFNKRVDGTGHWIFEDPTYLEWKENAGILWIQGKAGSGKTVLMLKILVQDLTQKQQQIYIIIDALDECVSKDESLVLNFLALLHQSFPVKIMISSRNHQHFEWKNWWTIFMSSNDKVDEDIATYVENQLQFVFESTNLATLKDEVKTTLMEKADGG
ncbi:hypothetical protein EV360DRAFT_66196 [Lentinula raphanica]|nr:hypothetical protein EV360DRAFT_66196 [Lentinula raphanica]